MKAAFQEVLLWARARKCPVVHQQHRAFSVSDSPPCRYTSGLLYPNPSKDRHSHAACISQSHIGGRICIIPSQNLQMPAVGLVTLPLQHCPYQESRCQGEVFISLNCSSNKILLDMQCEWQIMSMRLWMLCYCYFKTLPTLLLRRPGRFLKGMFSHL